MILDITQLLILYLTLVDIATIKHNYDFKLDNVPLYLFKVDYWSGSTEGADVMAISCNVDGEEQ